MAYYTVAFEGGTYISPEMAGAVLGFWGIAPNTLRRSRLILNTPVFGPLTDDEIKKCNNAVSTIQDFEAQHESLTKWNPASAGQEMRVKLDAADIVEYKKKRYTLFKNLMLGTKRSSQAKRFAIVRVCGRGSYVVLDHKNKDIHDPIIVTCK